MKFKSLRKNKQEKKMSMKLNDLAGVMVEGNKTAFKASAKLRTGKMINKRVVDLITPKLPVMIRGYGTTKLGQAVICNFVASAVIKYLPDNEKAVLAADAMITGAMDEFIGSFNIEEMIDEVLDGIDLSSLKTKVEPAQEAGATVLRRAADIVDTERSA